MSTYWIAAWAGERGGGPDPSTVVAGSTAAAALARLLSGLSALSEDEQIYLCENNTGTGRMEERYL